jgi:hypothetical protein
MRALNLFGIISSTILLAACAQDLPRSATGECQIFTPPDAVICGQTNADQAYIDEQIERGVQGCGWKRPPADTCQIPETEAKPAPKQRTIVDRILRRKEPAKTETVR